MLDIDSRHMPFHHLVQETRWVGRQDSVGPAPPFFGSGGPQTGVWSTKTTKDGKCLSVILIFW